jgi:hypothetical protein
LVFGSWELMNESFMALRVYYVLKTRGGFPEKWKIASLWACGTFQRGPEVRREWDKAAPDRASQDLLQ